MFIGQVSVLNEHKGFKLNWNPSTEVDFSHYSVYMTQESGRNYVHMGDTPDPSFTILETMAPGIYYFVVYANDTNNNRSAASTEFQITI